MVNTAEFDASGNEGTPNGVGGGNDTTSANDLQAFVYTFDPNNPSAAPVRVFRHFPSTLPEILHLVMEILLLIGIPGRVIFRQTQLVMLVERVAYTQPILSDIDFDPRWQHAVGFSRSLGRSDRR